MTDAQKPNAEHKARFWRARYQDSAERAFQLSRSMMTALDSLDDIRYTALHGDFDSVASMRLTISALVDRFYRTGLEPESEDD